jgi:hypothetical protein
MSAMVDFYLRRAAECARDAQETNLVNVRSRSLRSEAAWRAMADRLARIEEKKRLDALVKSVAPADDETCVPWPIAPHKPNPKRRD